VSGQTDSEKIASLKEEISRLTQAEDDLKKNQRVPSNKAKLPRKSARA
jgi:uncharacterized small protein (DUF1192 family)